MIMLIGLVALLIVIFILWKLFIDGWLFKIILFIAGWFGLYIWLRTSFEAARHIALTYHSNGSDVSFTWATIIPTVVCIMCLLCTRE
jgi:hypothetical protein